MHLPAASICIHYWNSLVWHFCHSCPWGIFPFVPHLLLHLFWSWGVQGLQNAWVNTQSPLPLGSGYQSQTMLFDSMAPLLAFMIFSGGTFFFVSILTFGWFCFTHGLYFTILCSWSLTSMCFPNVVLILTTTSTVLLGILHMRYPKLKLQDAFS